MSESRAETKDRHQALAREIAARRDNSSPASGAGKKGKEQSEDKGKGKGTKRQHQFKDWSDRQVRDEHVRVGQALDKQTFRLQEGRLTSGVELTRPYRTLPMFVGLMLTGFGGEWITRGSCYMCGDPHDTARCCRC